MNCSEELKFRSWHYVTVDESIIAVQKNDIVIEDEDEVKSKKIISDFECIMSIIDRKFLFIQAPKV